MFQPLRVVIRRHLFLSLMIAAIYLPSLQAATPFTAAPEIISDTWINSAPKSLADLRGRVVLVEFWTFGCWNCRNVEPHVKQWFERYNGQGLDIIAVHAPEFERERSIENVRAYVAAENITYPVAIDNDFANWRRYDNEYWPTIYLIDKRGILRHRKIGEGDYDATERVLRNLLAEAYP